MKKFLLLAFILFAFGKTRAQQNLLPDGGFEILKDSCQNYGGNDVNAFQYWWVGNTGSTDPYYCCYRPNGGYMCGYPGGVGGSQYPRTGIGFAGIYCGGWITRNLNYREYLQSNILQPLTAGKKYYGGFYVNMGENGKMFSVNNVGMLLSDSLAPADSIGFFGTNGVIYGNPQIMNDTNRILVDTTGWILVADTFIAQGGEKYLTIGNFRDDIHTIYVPTGYNCGSNTMDSASYYFIDDAFLYCVDTACPPFNPTAIHESHQQKIFDVYPNPNSGIFTLNSKITNGKIYVCNLLGEIIFQSTINNQTSTIDLSNEANGIYFVNVQTETNSFTQKIIIQK